MSKRIELHSRDLFNTLTKNWDGDFLKSESKVLYEDPETGMTIKFLRQFKGNITKHHRHNCAHGMFILKGVIYTDNGDFEPGSFLWFEEGEEMEHGAKYENVDCLFITNKTFDIEFLG